ncbi:hypothetical protein WR25_21767 [Diploscapter pachys]|uniref:Ground-like domain-containing protein n=1 Tax=Diploscapter pachys TaxID=2018661 RepID=A0A2A2LFR6_9BILA|nr:hypothetical protein WR25_21767 [Diploscapter pachys]
MEETYESLKSEAIFNPCNLHIIATKIQKKCEETFSHPFETIAAYADFAPNVHFAGDLICKIEIDGKYMISYATPYKADTAIDFVLPDGQEIREE